jgi:hypothetical protein
VSLDLDLEEVLPTDVFSTNITHNVIPMWREAGVYDALYMSEGKRAGDFIEALDNGVEDMSAHPDKYRAMDADNGWGTYEQALPWLKEVRRKFLEHPNAIIRVWK